MGGGGRRARRLPQAPRSQHPRKALRRAHRLRFASTLPEESLCLSPFLISSYGRKLSPALSPFLSPQFHLIHPHPQGSRSEARRATGHRAPDCLLSFLRPRRCQHTHSSPPESRGFSVLFSAVPPSPKKPTMPGPERAFSKQPLTVKGGRPSTHRLCSCSASSLFFHQKVIVRF